MAEARAVVARVAEAARRCHAAWVGTGRATRVGREEWARAQLHILNAS